MTLSARPRIKPIYPVYRLDAVTFRVGAQRGLTRQFRDPLGQLWTLIQIADGTRDVAAVVTAMRTAFPALSSDDVRRGLDHLSSEGLLEDARIDPDPGGAAGPSRFDGNVNHFRHYVPFGADPWSHQRRLRASRVVLLGLGGGGSAILPMLVALGIGRITAVDYDRVELGNLNRQFLYRESDVGQLKTAVAERVVRGLSSSTRFDTVTRRIESADDVLDLVDGADLVVCAVDEPPFMAQRRVNSACVAAGVTCLFGGSQVNRGRVYTVVPGSSGCFDCLNLHYTRTSPGYVEQFRGFHEIDFDPPTIAFPPDIFRLGSAIAAEAARLLTGYQPPVSIGAQVELDFATGSTEVVTRWPRDEECPTCGAGDEADWPVLALYPGQVWRSTPELVTT